MSRDINKESKQTGIRQSFTRQKFALYSTYVVYARVVTFIRQVEPFVIGIKTIDSRKFVLITYIINCIQERSLIALIF